MQIRRTETNIEPNRYRHQSDPIQSNPIQSNPIRSDPIQSNPIQSNTIQHNTIQYNTYIHTYIHTWGRRAVASRLAPSVRTAPFWAFASGAASLFRRGFGRDDLDEPRLRCARRVRDGTGRAAPLQLVRRLLLLSLLLPLLLLL